MQIYYFCYLLICCCQGPHKFFVICPDLSISTFSHLQVHLPFVNSFSRSLTNILAKAGIGTDYLSCLNTPFSSIRVHTASLANLLPNGILYSEKNFSTTTTVYQSLWDKATKAFSLNLCPQSFENSPSVRKSEHSYFADVKVCHKRPMSRCTQPLMPNSH